MSPAHRPALAVFLVALGFSVFSTMDAQVKLTSERLAVETVLWSRYAFHLLAMLLAAPIVGLKATFLPPQPQWLALRGLLLLGSTALFFIAISEIPLANAAAISFVTPLLTVALSVVVLKEHVGLRRWTAVGCGFLGVLVILRPGVTEIHPAYFLILVGTLCFACFTLITRRIGERREAPATLFYTALVGCIGASLILPFRGEMPAPGDWPILVVIGLLACLAELCLILGYRYAPASLLAPFQYVQMLWSTFYGFLLFGDLPDAWTVAGAAIIIGAGSYVVLREARVRPGPGPAADASARM